MSDQDLFMYGFITVISIIIWGLLTRWIHEIEKRNRYAEAQIRLLAHLSVAQGVDKKKVHDILLATKLPNMTFEGIINLDTKRELINDQYSKPVAS